jgi:hypothetical protein
MPGPALALQGYWQLEEVSGQRFDSSGQAQHLTDRNTVGVQPGKVGLAADFERSSKEYLLINDAPQLEPLGQGLSLVGWFKAETLEISQVIAAKYDTGANQRAYRLDLRTGNNIGFMISPDGVNQNARLISTAPVLLRTGNWYHLAAVFDAQQRVMSLYLDGERIGWRAASSSLIYDSSVPFLLGAGLYKGAPQEYFDGVLDEWRLYSRALSQAEIQNLMREPTTGPTATHTPTPTPTPTATETLTPEPTATGTPTFEPTATETPTLEPTATETSTPEPTATETPTPEPTATETPTPEPTATETPTPEPTATETPTPEPTATETPTPEPTATEISDVTISSN